MVNRTTSSTRRTRCFKLRWRILLRSSSAARRPRCGRRARERSRRPVVDWTADRYHRRGAGSASFTISAHREQLDPCRSWLPTIVPPRQGADGASGRSPGSCWPERNMMLCMPPRAPGELRERGISTLATGFYDDGRFTAAADDMGAAARSSTATGSHARRMTQCICSDLAPVEAALCCACSRSRVNCDDIDR